MKKTAIILLCAVILVIPTVIAIANYSHVKYAPAGEKDVTKVVIEDVDGVVTTYDREESEERTDEVIGLFFRLNSHKTEIIALPDTVLQEKAYLVTISTKIKSEEYRYYFSMDPNLCYLFGPDGKSYQLGPDDAAEFLSSDLSRSYYDNSSLPTLMLSGTYAVSPREASWTYKNFRGDAIVSDVTDVVSTAEQNFTEDVIFALSYETEPDYFGVKVTDSSGEVIFDDQKSNLGSFSVDSEKTVYVEVTSKWYEDESRNYSGEAVYSFGAQISPSPSFRLSADSVVRGGFLTVTGKNVADPAAVTFSTDPAVDFYTSDQFKLKFWQGDGLVRAIIPIHSSLEAGEYRITFTASGAEQSILVNVTDPFYPDSGMNVTDEKADECLSDTAKAEFENLIAEVTKEDSPLVSFDGYFLSGGENYTSWVIRDFGSRVLVNGGEKYSFINNGIDVQYGWAADVSALNSGTVVYTGETAFTGRIVVIEHGYGVRTWYWNLSDVSVSVGDTVEKGAMVGHAGSTGLTDMIYGGVHLAMSVGGYFVNPSVTWSAGITFPEFN
ncbi:MAG: M23 family metallopeptidase [Clostridia bacterium]|nr:M23 family metallopeptidase [Clostridia bacterium]